MIVAIADTALRSGIFSDRQGRTYRRFGHQPRRDVYLIEKGRIPANALNDLHAAIADSKAVLQHVPLDENFAMKMREVSRQDIPDLPDRVIAATAQWLRVPVLSRDCRIKSSTIQTIW